jgi:membrane protein YqaA with SNARE-associated domain
MLREVYDKVISLAARPTASLWLFAIAFAEAIFLPIPPDILLLPMGLARPRLAWRFAAITTIGSVMGGAIGYFVGYALFNRLAQPIIHILHYEARFAAFQAGFAHWGGAFILMQALLPIPFPIVTIACGAAKFNFAAFISLSLVSRGTRFFLEATLLRYFGEPAREFIEKRLGLVTAAVGTLIIAVFLLLKFA